MKPQHFYFFLFSLFIVSGLLPSCTPEKEEPCECCDVNIKEVNLSPPRTLLLSKYKSSDPYDVNPTVRIIKSHLPISTGMEIWTNGYWHENASTDNPGCTAVKFSLKEIQYFHYATLWIGFKTSKKALETNTLYAKSNTISNNYNTSVVFAKFYNELSIDSEVPYELEYDEKDSLIKGNYYGEFMYLGSIKWDVQKSNETLHLQYDHVFEVRTRDGAPEMPRFIYIDRDYGLVKYILNNGDVWSILHE